MRRMIERRPAVVSIAAFVLLAGLLGALLSLPGAAQSRALVATAQSAPIAVREVTCVGLTVSDMERSIAFFRDVLTFEMMNDVEVAGESYERLTGVFGVRMRIVTMRLGSEMIELTEYLAPRGRPMPGDSASNDGWFQHIAIIVPDMQRAYQHLRQHRVRFASTGLQRLPDWNPNAGGIEAFYFRDPDDHVLEILAFPPDKGDPKWQEIARRQPERLFLGIDHTAIVIGESEASMRFYQDLLGFAVAGTSENYGTEQEHLNNVFGARLNITSLRPPGARGPAIECLEYVTPRDGRPYPPDSRANDLWHWQTTLVVGELSAAMHAFDAARVQWISGGIVSMSDASLGFTKAALIRDPDGHALRLVER